MEALSIGEIKYLSHMPEYQNIEAFVEYSDGEFDSNDLAILNYKLHLPINIIKKVLINKGLKMQERNFEVNVRGFHANSHDRFTGPGSWSG